MAVGMSDFTAHATLDAILNSAAFDVAAVHLSAHDGNPGRTGANEMASTTRVDVSASFGAAGTRKCDNDAVIEMTNMPVGTVLAVGLWDAGSGGNFLWAFWLGGDPEFQCTANAGDDVITAYGHTLVDGDRVTFEARGGQGLPAGISDGTVYFVRDAATDTFKVSTTNGGAAVNITASGEAVGIKVVPKSIANAGDTLRIAVGQLSARLP